MNRAELLRSFEYLAFAETKNQICRRLVSIDKKALRFLDDQVYRISTNCRVHIGQATGRWSDLGQCLQRGDWLGLTLDSKKEITSLVLLAPNRNSPAERSVSRETLRQWQLFLATVRSFFSKQKFLEVQTPTLVSCPGTEPFLDVFETQFKKGQKKQNFYLPTSPELHLKKLVAAGYGSVFEIRPCFRNGEISEIHQPEFWMLEWYRPGQNLQAIQKDCAELVTACAKALKVKPPRKKANFSMHELFRKNLNFDLQPSTQAAELLELSKKRGLVMPKNSDFDDAFYFLFLEKIENLLPSQSLTFVRDYPPSQAALARLTKEGWGDRFEMYWKGMEIANAYHELNDPDLQRQRSEDDLEKRKQLGRPPLNLDQDFFRALDSGMPPTAGIALGLERLFLALTNKKSLTEIRLFPMTEESN